MTDAFFTCGVGSSGANALVVNHFQQLNTITQNALAQAFNFTGQLGSYQLPAVSFTVDLPDFADYPLRDVGTLPSLDPVPDRITDPLPLLPPQGTITPVVLDPLTALAPNVSDPNFPDAPITYFPSFGAPPVLDSFTPPTFGDRTQGISAPVFRTITVNPAPVIDWNALNFNIDAPVFNATPPDPASFNFVNGVYTPQLAGSIKPVILAMLNGQTGLPQAVEAALYARDAEREDENAQRAEQETIDEWATKGFTLPAGILNAKLARARQNSQNQRNTMSRDQLIHQHEVLLDQLKFGVAQGLAYENMFIQLFVVLEQMRLDAAKYTVDIALRIFEASIEQFKAEITQRQFQLALVEGKLKVDLGILQGYATYLQGQELVGQLNKQDLDLYLGKLQAVKIDADIYNEEAEVLKILVDTQTQKLEQAKLLIDEELAKLQASDLQVKTWSTEIQAESIKQQALATRASIYTTQVNAWGTVQNVKIENLKAEIALDEEVTNRYAATLNGFTAKLNYSKTLAELIAARNKNIIDGFSAQSSANSAFNTALVEKMRSLVAESQQNVELAIKNAEINAQNALEAKKVEEQALSTATQVLSSIASSALSAYNVGAHLQDSSSYGYSCNYNTSQSFNN